MKKYMMLAMLTLALAEGIGVPDILRLHVVANSNTDADQHVKLMVRDAIIEYMDEARDFETEQQMEQYVKEHLKDIERVAEQTLREAGMQYGAAAHIGIYEFPEKKYGDTVLPAGDYNALRVELGEGSGENWFCVLFPPLCYVETQQIVHNWNQEDGIQYRSLIGELIR